MEKAPKEIPVYKEEDFGPVWKQILGGIGLAVWLAGTSFCFAYIIYTITGKQLPLAQTLWDVVIMAVRWLESP